MRPEPPIEAGHSARPKMESSDEKDDPFFGVEH
jgi:hypothetical protein